MKVPAAIVSADGCVCSAQVRVEDDVRLGLEEGHDGAQGHALGQVLWSALGVEHGVTVVIHLGHEDVGGGKRLEVSEVAPPRLGLLRSGR